MLKTFAVIGDPIFHSLSPTIHNAAYRQLNLECTYIAYKIPTGELKSGIESLKSIKISGFNVTVPHKIEIMKFLEMIWGLGFSHLNQILNITKAFVYYLLIENSRNLSGVRGKKY